MEAPTTPNHPRLSGGDFAIREEVIILTAEEEERADRRFAAWQRHNGALVA